MSNNRRKDRSEKVWAGIAGAAAGLAVGAAAATYIEYQKERQDMKQDLKESRHKCVHPFVDEHQLQPQPGDLIEIQRKDYSHWAVCVANGYVIHLNRSDNEFHYKYMLTTMTKVLEGCKARVNNLETAAMDRNLVALEVDEIISRAYSKLDQFETDYHVFNNNCETFATWCRYGQGFSVQSEAKEGKPLIETFGPVVNEVMQISGPYIPLGGLSQSLQKYNPQ